MSQHVNNIYPSMLLFQSEFYHFRSVCVPERFQLSTWQLLHMGRKDNRPTQHFLISVLRGFYIQITAGCSNSKRAYVWEALLCHGCTTWSFTLTCTAPVTTLRAPNTGALISCRHRIMAVKCTVLKNGNFKNIHNSLSQIHCNCKYFYKYITLNVFQQMHFSIMSIS